jgi:hypothetical protein
MLDVAVWFIGMAVEHPRKTDDVELLNIRVPPQSINFPTRPT